MTPLAYRVTKNLTLPVKDRTFRGTDAQLRALDDMHCFNCTEVLDLATDLYRSQLERDRPISEFVEETAFLPARKTWIEYRDGPYPVAYLLVERGCRAEVSIYFGHPDSKMTMAFPGAMSIPLFGADWASEEIRDKGGFMARMDEHNPTVHLLRIYTFLAMINTPRIIGRRQHMPHRGLERRLVAMRGTVGKFPLHAWTEIKLEVTAPKDASGEGSQEAHYTGERALHFCRAHIRIRLGKLEVVRGHWRGDASLGIKQSRYKLVA